MPEPRPTTHPSGAVLQDLNDTEVVPVEVGLLVAELVAVELGV